MLVKHLIKELSKCNPEAQVTMDIIRSGGYREGGRILEENLSTYSLRVGRHLGEVVSIVNWEDSKRAFCTRESDYYEYPDYDNKNDTPKPLNLDKRKETNHDHQP